MSVLLGTGTGPVVAFTGGAILIRGASPTVQRTVLADNRAAARGSAVALSEGSTARLLNNNLIIYNVTAANPRPLAPAWLTD